MAATERKSRMLNLTVLSLSELKFTSPDSLVTREGEELTVPKKTLKILMNSLGLVGDNSGIVGIER